MCDLAAMSGSMVGHGAIASMTLIALDRYNVIVKGMAAKPLTMKGAILKILCVWLMATVWTVIPLLGWNRFLLVRLEIRKTV
jgi:r-opsin